MPKILTQVILTDHTFLTLGPHESWRIKWTVRDIDFTRGATFLQGAERSNLSVAVVIKSFVDRCALSVFTTASSQQDMHRLVH